MTKNQYNHLLDFCKSSKNERYGIINVLVDGNDIIFLNLTPAKKDLILKSTPNQIKFDPKKILADTMYGMMQSENGVYIKCHTHPSTYDTPWPSWQDINNLSYYQSIADKRTQTTGSSTTLIEAIITCTEIIFYYYDQRIKAIKRIPLLVDGIEFIPSKAKSVLELMKEGFAEGRKIKF